ncbi:hypothetical protein HBI62_041100 [Parastagonospora nodorum]|nr:hypothetical protein HBI62_041100 [Parastagonospora nodorum]KAH6144569.1 hypothetical protein HBI63_175900 [Parastagonospora nodorum]KAH6173986.1 hypothetical protein HBI61_156600 [Parastagonospora nodorum]
MHAGLRKELEARHSLLNLSVYDLVEEFARHSVYAVFKCLASSSNLSITIRCRVSSLIYTKQAYLYADKYSKKYLKVREADALKQVDANIRERENKNCSSLYYSDSNSDTATRKTRIKACERKARLDSLLDSDDYYLDSSLDINSKDNLEDEEATIAKNLAREQKKRLKALLNAKIRDSLSARNTFTLRTRQKCKMPKQKIAINSANSTLCNLSNLLVIRFCIFSNPALENISILTNKEVVEMQTNTATALANKLAAINKLVRLQTFTLKILEHANMPAVHPKATKHYLVLLAAQFALVCSFRKIDKHVFRAYNTISVIAQRTIIRKGSSYIEKRFNATNKRDSVTSDCIYKIEDIRNMITNIKHDVSEHESSYKDILEKEGLNELEASRPSYSALTTLKAAQFKIYSSCKVKCFTLNSVKNLFTNLSKDYFLVREARAITKSSLNIAAEDAAKAANILLLLKKVCAKILIESYKLIVQAIIVALIAFAEAITLTEATHVVIIELIVYFNLDSKLELKVLGKQDVKTTS